MNEIQKRGQKEDNSLCLCSIMNVIFEIYLPLQKSKLGICKVECIFIYVFIFLFICFR